MYSRNLYVAHTGQDVRYCGSVISPCRSVRFTVELSKPGDTIHVEHAQGKPYKECEGFKVGQTAIHIDGTLTIIGRNGKAVIQCHRNCTLFKLQGVRRNYWAKLRLVDLHLTKSSVAVKHVQTEIRLVVDGCVFRDNCIGIFFKESRSCSLRLENSSFDSHRRYGIVASSCFNTSFHITSSSFYTSPLYQLASRNGERPWQTYKMFISHCVFQGSMAARSYNYHVLTVYHSAFRANITIKDSIFKNHVGYGDVDHLLLIMGYPDQKPVDSFILTLSRLRFENNFYKKTVIDLNVHQTECYKLKIELTNCLFRNNTGTMELHAPMSPICNSNMVTLENNTFLWNHYFPHPDLTQIYPTLYLESGIFHITSCKFINNVHGRTPTNGVIFVSDNAVVTLEDCYFENSQVKEEAVQVYAYPSSKLVTKGNNTFNIKALKNDQMILVHLPFNVLTTGSCNDEGFVQVKGLLLLTCPRSYHALPERLTYEKSCKNDSTRLTYLAYSCRKCPRKTYSLERGEVNNNITRDIKCHECPWGGRCSKGELKARPNFWGYPVEKTVNFLDCPAGYCCDKHDCGSYNICSGNRTGTLCGRCPNGTSEALFSTACKPNKICNSRIFFPSFVALLFGYVVFFFYHVEIVRFLKRSLSLVPRLTSMESHLGFQETLNEATSFQASQGREYESTGGCIKIIFYYYQTIHLLTTSVGFEEKHAVVRQIHNIVFQVLDLIVTNVSSSLDCPFQNTQAVSKTLLLHSVGFLLLVFLGLLCVLWKVYRIAVQCRKLGRKPTEENALSPLSPFMIHDQEHQLASQSSFPVRVVSAFTHISLLMYYSTAKLCLTLLHCVPFKGKKILFIDGTVECFQLFQYFLLGYVVVSVLPFCFVPFLGSYVLTLGSISVAQFCLGCVFPLPFCCHWLRLLLANRSNIINYSIAVGEEQEIQRNRHDILQRKAILHVLSGPFRTHRSFLCFPNSPLPWESVLVFRRLVLILAFAFIYDKRRRMILALVICVIVLVTHMRIKPFNKKHENFLETLSLGTLVILCGLTLVKASYRGEDYSSFKTSSAFMNSLNLAESVLIIVPLAAVVCVVVLSLLVRFILLIRSCFQVCIRGMRRLGRW